ncbi:MAG: biotin/lipoyl-binding protein, partial [Candidatus Peregrinibacteria bacterium]
MKTILELIKKRKKTFVAVIILFLGVSYFGYKTWRGTPVETRYTTTIVQKGTLVTSIGGSGQISASNQVDIKSKASGDILSVSVKNGQFIKAGTILAQINAREAYKAVRDAQSNLESAKLTLEKLKKPADKLSLIQAENALAQA